MSSSGPAGSSKRAAAAASRIEQVASQLNVSPFTVKVGAGAAVGAVAAVAMGGRRAPFELEDPAQNTPETLPVYDGKGEAWVADQKAEATIHFAPAGPGSAKTTPAITAVDLVAKIEQSHPAHLALAVERPCPKNDGKGAESLPLDKWTKWTWKEYIDDSKTAAKAFAAFGMEQFGSITIFGVNAPEWHIGALGAMLGGGKVAGIYPSDTVEHCVFKNNCAGATVAVVETTAGAKMVLDNLERIPSLKAVIVYDPDTKFTEITSGSGCKYMRWDTMMKWAKGLNNDDEIKNRMEKIRPGHASNVVYTSGTTGNPKGVMLSHDNFCSACSIFLTPISKDMTGHHRILSYLPLPHVTGFLADIGLPLWKTAHGDPFSIYFARPYDLKESTIGARLAFVRPTLFVGVPRVYEKIAEKLKAVAATVKGPMKAVSTWAKAKNLEHMKNRQYGRGGNGEYPANFGPADFVMGKVRGKLGLDQCQVLLSGAAPITMETLEYFASLGLPILEVYGMSESTGPTTLNTNRTCKWGTIGYCPPGVEVCVMNTMDLKNGLKKIGPCKDLSAPTEQEQGELCFRGRHIMMGYLANPDLGEEHLQEVKKKNAEAILPDGWMLSGDKACMDKDGFFRITGRYKELIITAGGENVAPVPIEDWIKSNFTAISNVMMVGDKKKYNVILVTLKTKGATGELPGTDELDGDALKVSPGVTSLTAAIKDAKVQAYVKQAIDAVNKEPKIVISNACKVQDFRILPRDFSMQTEEFTPTFKVKRSVACEIWKDYIDQMYA
mmetsp:Transcript_14058/g.34825  ORF Transcript_14058/g.34825 Transcript_14058/m.34825 type:complete len:779 (+) Transcript_14058:115-2451(+)|eukprot:CAMPEP_0179000108 /NCGR_PEP_ID=MMETSP0795-20121207/10472_1 /TAXON_ID=88552 /ORGANISM="Amoebophrya sp., Strain Ameob2" /LENGTH=778 /DNA_ID=CAMNT_0020693035 /DNA_START=95 /DNA_END=2431 /DNA_ORIENTATION=+